MNQPLFSFLADYYKIKECVHFYIIEGFLADYELS